MFQTAVSELVREEEVKDQLGIKRRAIVRDIDLALFNVKDVSAEDLIALKSRVDESVKLQIGDETGEEVDYSVCLPADFLYEKFALLSMLFHFLTDHSIPSLVPDVPETSFFAALLVLPHELVRHGYRDHSKAAIYRDAVVLIYNAASTYDFRNGGLRRKYDAIKWKLKELEDLCCSLALSGTPVTDSTGIAFPTETVETVIRNLRTFDDEREFVIKAVRDVTRWSKMAINSLHRAESEKAMKLLDDAKNLTIKLHADIVSRQPALNSCLSNGIEEYLEGLYFSFFLAGKDLHALHKMDSVFSNPVDVMGALSDLTGEIGRWAVNQATAGNPNSSVEKATKFTDSAYSLFLKISNNKALKQKKGAVQNNLNKLEKLQSDISIAKISRSS
jgi:predicted translin family RNA/ssDNA-binding protein